MQIGPGFRSKMMEMSPADMKALDDLRRRREAERQREAREAEQRREAEEHAKREVDEFRGSLERAANPDPNRPDIRELPDRVKVGRVEVPRKEQR